MTLGITVLGSSGTWASSTSACSGYLLDHGDTRIWIDCGPGTFMALQQHCSVADLSAIVITHEHPDHCLELPVIRNAMRYGLELRDLPLIAPRGVFALCEALLGSRGISPWFLPKMIGNGSSLEVEGVRLRFSRTDHPVETLAVQATIEGEEGPSLVYSSDTGPDWEPSRFAGPIGLAIHEATFLAADTGAAEGVHSTAEQAGAAAARAGVDRLVITHIPPTGDPAAHRAEAEAAFGRPVSVATPHERYEV